MIIFNQIFFFQFFLIIFIASSLNYCNIYEIKSQNVSELATQHKYLLCSVICFSINSIIVSIGKLIIISESMK